MVVSCRKFLLFLLFFAAIPQAGFPFADNNVRNTRFKWKLVQTPHFDIYYDESTERMVPRMAKYLEGAWAEVGKEFQFYVPERTPFFFYSNHNEFEQTNIVSIGEGTGGVTEAFKNRFLIFNDGSEEWLRHVIYHEFTHVVQFNILYGGFWKSVRLLKSPFFPLWLMEGSAELGSGDIDDPNGDMVVRDALAHNQLPLLAELQGFAHLKPNQVTLGYKTGDAAMEFLKDEFGYDTPRLILDSMTEFFDISSALENTLGLDLNRFDFRFREWMTDKYADFFKNAKEPTHYGRKITKSAYNIPQFNESPAISPDGRKIYYMSDIGGPTQIFVYDTVTNKSKPLIKLNYSSYEYMQTRGRALSISKDGRWLAFAGEKRQRDYLYLFDLARKRLKRVKVPFDEIRTPVFSPVDDNQIACVGMIRGYNDIFIIGRNGKLIERLTDNPQDERGPVFTADGKTIYYSGEVLLDDLSDPAGRDIFSVNVHSKEISTVISSIGSEQEPEILPDGSLIYVRDMDDEGRYGFNFWKHDFSGGQDVQLTNFIGGGFTPTYSAANQCLYYVGFNAGEKHIYQTTVGLESAQAAVITDVPLNPNRKTAAPFTWPADTSSPLFSGIAKPYRFKASTDLFLPFFFYSTADGLVLVDVWQVSEMLGNHQFQQQMQYASGNDYIDLSLFYTYARFRPQFSLGVRGAKYYSDIDEQEQRRELNAIGLMNYPFDRVSSMALGAGVTHRSDTYLDELSDNLYFRDRFIIGALRYDTVTGRYLVPTKGNRLDIFYQQGFERMGGNQEYRTGGIEGVNYAPLPRESTFATRLFYGRSTGEDRQVFRMGGVDKIRSISSNSEEFKKSNVVMGSGELRLRMKYLNARTKFLFPDFFFKAAYLIMFDDFGYGWDTTAERDAFKTERMQNSAGLGVSWPTFIMQTFKIDFTIQWARRTTTGDDLWYVSVGPSY